ncbi:hypothetical protein RKK42_14400 [Klebsiella pneumoniae]|nr:hypothetical protein [Klebsiella pneumoniae]
MHLIGAYPVTPINIAIELPDFDPSVYNDAIRGQHLLAMKALRQKFGIDEKFTHVEKGLPEEVIPDLAEHLQAGDRGAGNGRTYRPVGGVPRQYRGTGRRSSAL